MDIVYLIIILILGFHIGSFLSVVAHRIPRHESFLLSQSHCDICNHKLKFYEMIPIVSYIIQGGRCNHCNGKISSLLIISELLTGILFALSFYIFGFSYNFIVALCLISFFIIVLNSDVIYLIIPDSVIVFFSILIIGIQLLNIGIINTFFHILCGVFLFLLMYFIMLLGNKLFKKESMGGADIKMMFIFGLIVDPLIGCITIFLGSFLALPVSIFLLIKKKEHIIPFGPFLILALIIVYLLQLNSIDIINFFSF